MTLTEVVLVVVDSVVVGLASVAVLLLRATVLAVATLLAVAAFAVVVLMEPLRKEASWVDFCLARLADRAAQYLTASLPDQRKVAVGHHQAEVLTWAPAVESKVGAS